ncbi:MAG: M48 family metalloprotease [Polyangiaceae bacterium]
MLPSWCAWAGPCVFLAWCIPLLVLVLVLAGRLFLRPLLRAQATASVAGGELHWTERARLLMGVRSGFLLFSFCLLASAPMAALGWAGAFSRFGPFSLGALALMPLWVVYRWWVRNMYWLTFGVRETWREIFRGQLLFMLLRPWMLITALALLAPKSLFSGWTLAWFVFGCGCVLSMSLGWTLRVGRLLGVVLDAPARVVAMVDQLAAPLGISVNRVYVVRTRAANAAALVIAGVVIFTEGLIENFSETEIRAITAHEIGHLSEPASTKALRVGVGLGFAPLVLLKPIGLELGTLGVLFTCFVALLVPALFLRQSRKLESRADRHAAAGDDSQVFARALEKLAQVNGMPVVTRGRGTHPNIYDRLLALGYEPDYPKPEPVRTFRGSLHLGIFFMVVFGYWGAVLAPAIPERYLEDPLDKASWRLSTKSGEAQSLVHAAEVLTRERRFDLGDLFYAAALKASDKPRDVEIRRVEAYARVGRCADAERLKQAILRDLPWSQRFARRWERVEAAVARCQEAGERAPTN